MTQADPAAAVKRKGPKTVMLSPISRAKLIKVASQEDIDTVLQHIATYSKVPQMWYLYDRPIVRNLCAKYEVPLG